MKRWRKNVPKLLDTRTVSGLAGLFGLIFAIGAILIAAAVYGLTQYDLYQAEDQRLLREYHRLFPAGLNASTTAIVARRIEDRHRQRSISEIDHRLTDKQGRVIAGTLTVRGERPGISDVTIREAGSPWGNARALTVTLPDGGQLVIAAENESAEEMGKLLWPAFWLALVLAILVGIVTSIALGRSIARRLSAIGATATAIIAGDHSRRVPIDPLGGFFADQADIFNRMLDRIDELMANLRQVSSDLAHDLRTPLTRLRATLHAIEARDIDDPQRAHLVQAAQQDCDGILTIFTALLRISEVEAGQQKGHLRTLSLGDLAEDIVESFTPEFSDAGRTLLRGTVVDGPIVGDVDLINQLLVNLVVNALVHTHAGSVTTIEVREANDTVELIVQDTGPGIPLEERAHVLNRFVRLERSRSTPGHGLGLSLVAAIARFHDASVVLEDAGAGLAVRVVFPMAGTVNSGADCATTT